MVQKVAHLTASGCPAYVLLLLCAHGGVPVCLVSHVKDVSAQAHLCAHVCINAPLEYLLCTYMFVCQCTCTGKHYHLCTWKYALVCVRSSLGGCVCVHM